jgi:type IV pilus assembly protein PilE
MKFLKKKWAAFNLQELLVVLVIIGILLLLALPKLMPLISKTKSIEAQTQLKHLQSLERQYFFMHSKYSSDFQELGFEAPKTVAENGNANYVYEIILATHNEFKATATALTDFDGDGVYNVWQINQNLKLLEIRKD